MLNKASACAKYALRFLNLKRGSLFVFGKQAQAVGEGVLDRHFVGMRLVREPRDITSRHAEAALGAARDGARQLS